MNNGTDTNELGTSTKCNYVTTEKSHGNIDPQLKSGDKNRKKIEALAAHI